MPPSGEAVHCRSSTAHCPQAVRQCNAAVLLPTAPGQCGSALHELHCTQPPGSDAVLCRSVQCCTAWCYALHRTALRVPCCTAVVASGQWAVELLQCNATLPGGSGRCNSCKTLPHCLGQWAVELLQCTATLPGGSGQWNSCNALPHHLGALGGATATHTVQWAH